jgi:hypothetical protein
MAQAHIVFIARLRNQKRSIDTAYQPQLIRTPNNGVAPTAVPLTM